MNGLSVSYQGRQPPSRSCPSGCGQTSLAATESAVVYRSRRSCRRSWWTRWRLCHCEVHSRSEPWYRTSRCQVLLVIRSHVS